MRKLARSLGFGRERAADAVRSKRKRNVRENLQTSFTKHPESKQKFSKIELSKAELAGVGMGGAIQKLNQAMDERSHSSFFQTRVVDDEAQVPRPTESGVFVTSPRPIDLMGDMMGDAMTLGLSPTIDTRAIEEVTLIVYGWENVQPGTLSWVFPSLRSALTAVRAMRNAIRWAVLHGSPSDGDEEHDVDTARASGRVLVEAN